MRAAHAVVVGVPLWLCLWAGAVSGQVIGERLTTDEIIEHLTRSTLPLDPLALRRAEVAHYSYLLGKAEHTLTQPAGALAARKILERCPEDLRGFEWHYLHRKAHTDGAILKGHEGRVLCAVFSPDNRILASGGVDHTVRLWNLDNGKTVHTLKGHKGPVLSLAFHPDGKTLATGSADLSIKLWTVNDGKLVSTIVNHPSGVAGLAYSPDGNLLASFSNETVQPRLVVSPLAFSALWLPPYRESRLQIHDLKKHDLLSEVIEPNVHATCLAFGPDSKLLAVGGTNGATLHYDAPLLRGGTPLRGVGAVTGLFFQSPKNLVTTDQRGLRVWDVPAAREVDVITSREHASIQGLAVNAAGTTVALLGPAKVRVMHAPFTKAAQHFDVFTDEGGFIALHPRGHLLAMDGFDHELRLLDVGEQTAQLKMDAPVIAVQAAQDRFLVSMRAKAADVLLTPSGEPYPRPLTPDSAGGVLTIAAQPHGRLVATAGIGGTIQLWDPAGPVLERTLPRPVHLPKDRDAIRSLAFSADGKKLAAAHDQSITVWDVATGKELGTLRGHTANVNSIAFVGLTSLIVSAGGDGTVRLWDAAAGKELQAWKAHNGAATCLAIAPDGKSVASAGLDSKVRIWKIDPKAATRRALHTLDASTGLGQSLAFSPDGKRLAAGGAMGAGVTLWEAETGQEVFHLPRSTGILNTISFGLDGRTLFSGSYDGTVMLWKARPVY